MKPRIVIEDEGGSGARWSFDLLRDRLECPARAACFRGADEDGRPVFIKGVEPDDEVGLERAEREIAALRRIGPSPHILALLGTGVTATGRAYRVFEWADVSLHELLPGYEPALRPVLAEAVEEAIVAALRDVHRAGLVHCDVAPNNIVRVAGRWKLADFDVAVPEGEPTVGQARLSRYVSPGRTVGAPARRSYDWDALREVVAAVRGVAGDPSIAV